MAYPNKMIRMDGHEQEDHCRACVPENVIELLSNKGYELFHRLFSSRCFSSQGVEDLVHIRCLKIPLQGGGLSNASIFRLP